MATWPSGKAEACKAFTPGSNPGVAFFIVSMTEWSTKYHKLMLYGKYRT